MQRIPCGGRHAFQLLAAVTIIGLLGGSFPPIPVFAAVAPAALTISVGSCAVVVGANSAGGLKVRSGPGTNYSQVGTIYDGTVVQITGGPSSGSGYTWWKHDHGGWSAANWLADTSCSGGGSGNIQLATGLQFTPSSPSVGQSTAAYYQAKNNGSASITLGHLGVKCRRNSDNANYDYFWHTNVTLNPGDTFTDNDSRSFDQVGSYWCTANYEQGGNWNDVKWPSGSTNYVTINVQSAPPPPSAGNLVLIQDLQLSTTNPQVNQSVNGSFRVKNTGGQAITLQNLGIQGRLNGDLNGTARDFNWVANITLQPNDEYGYSSDRSFDTAGSWSLRPNFEMNGAWSDVHRADGSVNTVWITVQNTPPPPPPGDDASLVSQSGNPVAQPGQFVQVYFDLLNSGSAIWTSGDNYYLGLTNGASLGAPQRIDLANNVASGQAYRWLLNLVAPSSPGVYHTEWRLFHGSTAFGPTLAADVTTAASADSNIDLRVTGGLAINTSTPSTGQPLTIQYTLHNFGSQTANLRLVGVGGRGPDGDGDIEDYPWFENASIPANGDLSFSQTRGFDRSGIYSLFPAYQLSDGTWHEMALASGGSARLMLNIAGSTTLQSFDITYLTDSKEVMLVNVIPTSYPVDGSIIANVSVRNPKNIPTMMSVTEFGNVSQPSGYIDKAASAGTIPVGPNSTVTFHDVQFYPGSHLTFQFAAFGYGADRDSRFLTAFHVTEILTIAVFGFIPSDDMFQDTNHLLDGGLEVIASALPSTNLDWLGFGKKLGSLDLVGALKDLPGLAEHFSGQIAALTGLVLKSPLPEAAVKSSLKFLGVFLRVAEAYPYLRDLYQAHAFAQATIAPSTRLAAATTSGPAALAPQTATDVDPADLAAAANGAVVVATSSEHTSGWEQQHLIDGSATTGWGSAAGLTAGEWSIIRLANHTPVVLTNILINPGPSGGDPNTAALKDFHVDASVDGVNFYPVLSGSFAPNELGQSKSFVPAAVTAEYIRIVVDSNQGNGTPAFVSVGEIDVRGNPYSADDVYEPDRNPAQAVLVDTSGAKRWHTAAYPGDEDWVRFDGVAGSTYVIQTSDLAAGSSTILELYGPDGATLIASSDHFGGGLASQLIWTAPADGPYFVKVRQSDPAAYGDNTGYNVSIALKLPNSIYLPIVTSN